ncbi:MAG: PAS domain S-box protein [Cyanobacteria bacterium CRU_2_1]|nr:PAS domain S-box protein [Cyanobacteria bacterium CRU_2_1]
MEDGKFRYVGLNPTHERLTGIASSELCGKTPEQVLPPEAATVVLQHYRDCVAAGESITYEECLLFQGQETCWITNLTPLHNEQSRIYRIIGTSINITERDRTEQELRLREAQLRSLYEMVVTQELTFEQRVQRFLELGCRCFDLDIGIFSQIEEDCYELMAVHGQENLQPGDVFDLSQTYCAVTINSAEPIGFEVARESEWMAHPCYQAFRLEAYLGMRVVVNGQPYGTLNFSSLAPRPRQFTTADRELIQLMAQWIGNALEHQRAEAALHQSEKRYRAIVEDQTEFICRFLPDSTILFVNEAFCRFFGKSKENLIGSSYEPILFEDDREKVAQLVKSMSLDNPVVRVENRVVINGEILWTQWISRMIFDEQDRFIEYQAVGRDVTDIKQAEEALRQNEERWQLAIYGNNDGIWDHDLVTNTHFLSPRCLEMLGYDYEEVRTFNHWIRYIHPEDVDLLKNTFQRHLNQETSFYACEYRIRCRNGDYKWILARGKALWNEKGEPIRAVGSLTDISDRKQAEAELKAQQAFLRQVIDVVPSAIFVKDKNGGFLTVNQAAAAMYGSSTEKMVGKQDVHFNSNPLQVEEFLSTNQEVMTTLQPKIIPAEAIKNFRGELRWYQTIISPFVDVNGQVHGIIGAATDITELKKTEEELRHAKEAAETANRAKSTFLANMSHELRTPLNAILGFAELLDMDSSANQEQREQLKTILRSGRHLLELINGVLNMSKIDAGQITLNETSFDLYQLLNGLHAMLSVQASFKKLQFHCNYASDIPRCIWADEGKLRQILTNLLGNAVKFTEEGSVTLRVKRDDRQNIPTLHLFLPSSYCLLFEVADTGPGIAAAEIDQLFKPFVQTETGRQLQQGTGLGLAISQKFARMMGGEISVSSTLGEGTTFRFSILVRSVKPDSTPTLPNRSQQIIGLAPEQLIHRILVVEDQIDSCNLVAKLLTRVGFDVREAANGQDAIALWKSWAPHLILMDMQMPIMDGYESTQLIRQQEQGNPTKIVALTASAFEEQRSQILATGCDEVVHKPYKVEDLYTTIAKHLGVRYVYAADHNQETAIQDLNSIQAISAVDLEIMPEAWRTELRHATACLNEEQCLELIEQIPPQHSDLARALENLVNTYRFDIIMNLTQAQSKK